MQKCLACGGTYEPMQADGTEYYHVCALLSARELQTAIDAGLVRLPRADAARVQAAKDADKANPVAAGELPRELLALHAIAIERPNKRDENTAPGSDTKAIGRVIKAEGAGVESVTR